MKLNPDDPRLTAYALGELPADEASLIEAELKDAPEARAVVDETRAFAALLVNGLTAEVAAGPDPALDAAIRQKLVAPAESMPPNVVEVPPWRFGWPAWLSAAAAVGVLAMGIFLVTQPGAEFKAQNHAAVTESTAEPTPPSAVVSNPALPEVTPANLDATRFDPAPTDAYSQSSRAPKPATTPALDGAVISSPQGLPQTGPAPATDVAANAPAPGPVAQTTLSSVPTVATPAANPVALTVAKEVQPKDDSPRLESDPGHRSDRAESLAPAAPPPAASAPREKSAVDSLRAGGDQGMEPSLRSRYGLGPARPLGRNFDRAGGTLREEQRLSAAPGGGGAPLSLADSASELRRAPSPRRPFPIPQPRPSSPEPESSAPNNPGYVDVGDHPFRSALQEPLSTFALDVDTGSYPNIRRFLNAGQMPPSEAVRLEEMVNYFRYEVAASRGDDVFGVAVEVAACPWAPDHRLVRLAIQAREPSRDSQRPAGNLVFLVDVSGSMQPPERLPLLKQALKAMVRRLSPADRVAIVTYATTAALHLPSTSGEEKDAILAAIDALGAGGSTNGEGGIRQAYEVAAQHFLKGGVNRVLLCTDGDFNVGVSNQDELVRLIETKAKSGVFLTTLGVGTDNFKDALMRRLADRGNGTYHYLDSFEEAQRVLISQMDATLVTVARDAKAQVEFNPGKVGSWRLLGYEKRLMAHADFNDDTKDAGEVGAGHVVTVLYELLPPGVATPVPVDHLKYQRDVEPPVNVDTRQIVPSGDLLTLKLRYQKPEGSKSALIEVPVLDDDRSWSRASADFKFAAAVASFGMVLKESAHRGNATFDSALELGREGLGSDPEGWRAEFLALVAKAQSLKGGSRDVKPPGVVERR